MNDELKPGDIIYYVSPEKMAILEVIKVKQCDDMHVIVDIIDRITSMKARFINQGTKRINDRTKRDDLMKAFFR